MKNFFLKFRIQRYLKNTHKKRTSVNFKESKNIGILLDSLSGNHMEVVDHLVTELQNQGKKIETLCYVNKVTEPVINSPYHIFSRKDITLAGKFKNKAVNDFLNTEFDYIFSLTSNSILAIENILANCSAKCRVGFFNEDKKDFFDIMIKPTSLKVDNKTVNDMLFYLKKIND